MQKVDSSAKLENQYVTAKRAAEIFGVHKDFLRKCAALRPYRIALTKRTHVYPLADLKRYFESKRIR